MPCPETTVNRIDDLQCHEAHVDKQMFKFIELEHQLASVEIPLLGLYAVCMMAGNQADKPDAEARIRTRSIVHMYLILMCHCEDETVGLGMLAPRENSITSTRRRQFQRQSAAHRTPSRIPFPNQTRSDGSPR